MLAAVGLLGLLLAGAAVSGLLAGDAEDTSADDLTPDESDGANDAAARDAAGDDPAVGLARLLFGEKLQPEALRIDDPARSAAPYPQVLSAAPDAGGETDADVADGRNPDLYLVIATTPFGEGPDLPLVHDFDSATDRLILDFEGTEEDAPDITVDLEAVPGHAIVKANAVPVTMVQGATGLTPGHVDIVMTGQEGGPATVDDAGHVAGIEGGDSVHDAPHPGQWPPVVPNFDPERNVIEVFFDPAVISDPEVGVVDFENGTGADITVNGETILSVKGAAGLDPGLIELRAMPAGAAGP